MTPFFDANGPIFKRRVDGNDDLLAKEPLTGVDVPRGLLEFARDIYLAILLSNETIFQDGKPVLRHAPVLRDDEEFMLHLKRQTYREEEGGAEKVMYRGQFWFPQSRKPRPIEEAKR